jgi:hypothetical protein
MFRTMASRLAKVARCKSGNFAITTALLATPMLMLVGGAIDISFAFAARGHLQAVADGAALDAAREFHGDNAHAVRKRASAFFALHHADHAHDVAFDNDAVSISIGYNYPAMFSGAMGITSIPISVSASAVSPAKPKAVVLTPTSARGHWYKKVTIRITRPDTDVEEVLATIVYQPAVHDGSGSGALSINPAGALNLGAYRRLILQMDIKRDGCAVGHKATHSGNYLVCVESSSMSDARFDATLRTDDSTTTHYLFVNGKQLEKGSASPLNAVLPCGAKAEHAWEDGGNFALQDFFYTVEAECFKDKIATRLTR